MFYRLASLREQSELLSDVPRQVKRLKNTKMTKPSTHIAGKLGRLKPLSSLERLPSLVNLNLFEGSLQPP